MGVWIETGDRRETGCRRKSHPVWVCGLKQVAVDRTTEADEVTPCMGVWIETFLF